MKCKDSIEIVRMDPEMVEAVKRLEVEGGLSFWSKTGYFEELRRDDSIALVAISSGILVGFIIARLITTKLSNESFESELDIYNIAVEGRLWRRGIGKALIKKCLTIAKESGCSKVWLEVRESNLPAIEFYRKNGFEFIYKRKNFYNRPVEDALVLGRRL